MQCVGAVGAALQAATLVGGPVVVKHYQRVRAALGLPDNSLAAVEAREREAAGEDVVTGVAPTAAGRARPSPLKLSARSS